MLSPPKERNRPCLHLYVDFFAVLNAITHYSLCAPSLSVFVSDPLSVSCGRLVLLWCPAVNALPAAAERNNTDGPHKRSLIEPPDSRMAAIEASGKVREVDTRSPSLVTTCLLTF